MEDNGNNNIKRPMSLELNSGKQNTMKPKLSNLAQASSFQLDANNINITTPDIEKLLLPMLPTPSINNLGNPPMYNQQQHPPNEKEEFSMGFMEALHNLHKNENQNQQQAQQKQQQSSQHTNGMSGGSFTYNNLNEEPFPVVVKEEPSANSTPPHSPIDMENQEKIKLERKRQRNRVAASKCRKRKLERISKLDDRVKCLKGENSELGGTVKALKEQISQLKQKVIEHIKAGCEVPVGSSNPYLLAAK